MKGLISLSQWRIDFIWDKINTRINCQISLQVNSECDLSQKTNITFSCIYICEYKGNSFFDNKKAKKGI